MSRKLSKAEKKIDRKGLAAARRSLARGTTPNSLQLVSTGTDGGDDLELPYRRDIDN